MISTKILLSLFVLFNQLASSVFGAKIHRRTDVKEAMEEERRKLPFGDWLPQPKPKIVGGTTAIKGRYPYLVSLLTNITGTEQTYCGGSLIAPEWILSAAHCHGVGTKAQIGRFDFNDPNESKGVDYEEIEFEYSIIHPNYNNLTLDNDAMLIKLKEPSKYPSVRLDDGSTILELDSEFTIMGWGKTSTFSLQSSTLLETYVDPVLISVCNRRYAIYGGITENMMCAGKKGKDSCQGDSGGPLIIKGDSWEEDVQIGITSWGIGCGTGLFPGVYTRLSNIQEFIDPSIHTIPTRYLR